MAENSTVAKYAPVITQAWKCYKAKEYEQAFLLIREGLTEGDIPSLFAPSCVWIVYQHLKSCKDTISLDDFRQCVDYFLTKVEKKPELSRSLFLLQVLDIAKCFPEFDFAGFCIEYDLSVLREEDFVGRDVTADEGKRLHYESLAEKIACRLYNVLKGRHDPDTADRLLPFFLSVRQKCRDNRFIAMYIGLLYFWTGKTEEAKGMFIQILLEDPQWYIWKNMMLVTSDTQLKSALCCKALSMVSDEKFRGNLHLQLASLLMDTDPSHAAMEIRKYMETYHLYGWRICGDAYLLENRLSGVKAATDAGVFYYCCPLKLFEHKKIGPDSSLGIQPI